MTYAAPPTVALRESVWHALRAPSVHNTQPWRFVLYPDALEVRVDRRRQLPVLDPTGRQMFISVGCALFNARTALAATGTGVTVHRFPKADDRDLVARLELDPDAEIDPVLAELDSCVLRRQTNRRRFTPDELPPDVVERLKAAAAAEGAELVHVTRPEERLALARLSQYADSTQIADPAYRAEVRLWTNTGQGRLDGVPAFAVPHVDGTARDDIPIRDFDMAGEGRLPPDTQSSMHQTLLVLATAQDDPEHWLWAGEALERVWLELTHAEYVASIFTQTIEVPAIRSQLRTELRVDGQPHIVLRAGHAPVTSPSLRRHLSDVLVERLG